MRIVLTVIFLLCGLGASAGSQPPFPSAGEKRGKTYTESKDQNEKARLSKQIAPFTAKIVPLDAQKKEIAAEKRTDEQNNELSEKWWWSSPDVWVAIFTAILSAITGILAFFTYRLWAATKTMVDGAEVVAARQAAEMQESLRIAEINAKATEKAAEAAKQSADAIPSTERAFVFVTVELKGGNISRNESGQHCGTFIANIINHGKTPALLTKLYFDQVVQSSHPTVFTETPDTNFPPGCAIASGAFEPVSTSFRINVDDFEKIERNELKWFCYGRVEYRDIFGNLHKTGFCFEYFRQGSYGGINISRGNDLNYYD